MVAQTRSRTTFSEEESWLNASGEEVRGDVEDEDAPAKKRPKYDSELPDIDVSAFPDEYEHKHFLAFFDNLVKGEGEEGCGRASVASLCVFQRVFLLCYSEQDWCCSARL